MVTASVRAFRSVLPAFALVLAGFALPGAAFAGGPDPAVSTQEMLSRIAQPWAQLIDIRSADEFEARDIRALRGGHIPGAINLPADENGELAVVPAGIWLDRLDRRKETIVYGHDAGVAWRAAEWLRAQGFRQVRVYAEAWQHWGNSFELPVAGERQADVAAMRDQLLALRQQLAGLAAR